MNTEDLTALQIVKLGYAIDDPTDNHRCLNFRVGFNDHEAAFSALVAIGDYNEFNGARVADAIMSAKLDRYRRVSVGREGSPVVYIAAYGDDEQKRVMDALRAADADECDVTRGEIRAWWD